QVNLCDLLLEELSIYNDPEILDEVLLHITKILAISANEQNYFWLAEAKLLQSKLALIQMKIDDAKLLMTEAQRIADLHGLNLLAMRISSEHDNLLNQLNIWDDFKNKRESMSERIKLASVEGVIGRIQGRSAVEPPELDNEEPVLILIIAEGGTLIFSNIFAEDFPYEEDLISGFLSAFNTFSGELFSKGLDRAKFGEYTILMEPINSFSVCYLFKGQTYQAKQKLTTLIEKLQQDPSIWETLEKYYKTNQVAEVKDIPVIESILAEIFLT
ncbi:MAG: hypothetical protein ACW99L_17755, partial [Promethearchaeota archaeon]